MTDEFRKHIKEQVKRVMEEIDRVTGDYFHIDPDTYAEEIMFLIEPYIEEEERTWIGRRTWAQRMKHWKQMREYASQKRRITKLQCKVNQLENELKLEQARRYDESKEG